MTQYCVKYYAPVKPHIAQMLGNTLRMSKADTEPLRRRLGRNLKFILMGRDQSQRAAAAAGKMNDKTFNNLAEARFDPRLAQVEKAAAAVGVEAWQLLACDFENLPADPKDVLKLLDLYSRASPQGRAAIMQVAAAVVIAA